jgi:hypothetical protein
MGIPRPDNVRKDSMIAGRVVRKQGIVSSVWKVRS